MVSALAQDFHDVIDVARLVLVIERRCNGVGRFRAVLNLGQRRVLWNCGLPVRRSRRGAGRPPDCPCLLGSSRRHRDAELLLIASGGRCEDEIKVIPAPSKN